MANESDIDRMIRAADAVDHAQQQHRLGTLDFLESAIDHGVFNVAVPICNGMKRAIGNTSPTEPLRAKKGCRAFWVWGEHRRSGVRVELEVHVDGIPKIVKDPRGVLYRLRIDGRIAVGGRWRKKFSWEPAENRTGRPIPTDAAIAELVSRNVAAVLGIDRR
jgi:hypothetical protein